MACTHEIPHAKDNVAESLASGDAILVTSIIPEENENALLEAGLVTRLSCNRVIYPEAMKAAGWAVQLIGQMNEYSYRYARIERGLGKILASLCST